jgi:hypothetical protein
MTLIGVAARSVQGAHQPIGLVAVDTNITGNGTSTAGMVEPCANIPAVGGTKQIDVVLKSVPAEGLVGAAFDLRYDPTKIKVTAYDANIMMPDAFVFLSDPLPDADGGFRLEIVDLDVPGYASGDGALVRFTVQAVGNGSTPVYLSDVVQGDFTPNFIAPDGGEVYPVAVMESAQITVGATNCLTPTPTPTAAPTVVPTAAPWSPAAKKLNNWTWYRSPNGLTTSYWFECGSSTADCASRWSSPNGQSLSDWNSRPSAVKFDRVADGNSSAEVLITAVDTIPLNPGILGLARAFDSGFNPCPSPPTNCTERWGEVWVADTEHIQEYGVLEQRRATVAHELGHVASLAHESVNHQCGSDASGAIPHSIMAYDCINPVSLGGEGEVWVQDFDVCGVNQRYVSSFGDAGCLDQPTQPSYFHSLPPCRLLDTRDGTGVPAPGKVGAGQSLSLLVATRCGVTSMPQVSAVVLNVAVTQPTAPGYFTVYPSDASRPLTANLNFLAGETRPNSVTARVGADGKVKIYNSGGSSHIVADVFGYYGPQPAQGERFNSLAPARILDTRNGTGGVTGKIGAGDAGTLTFTVAGKGGVPSAGQVKSVALSVAVTQPTAGSYLTIYPAELPSRPNASNLNFKAGATVPNLVTTRLSPDGKIKIYNLAGATHVVIDVAGWYTTGPSGDLFHAVTPARALDTRYGTGGKTGKLGAAGQTALKVAGVGGLPVAGAAAVVTNTAATQPSAGSFMTLYPSGTARPNASNLNYSAGQTISNATVTRVGSGGRIQVYNNAGSTHAVVDLAGWFGP